VPPIEEYHSETREQAAAARAEHAAPRESAKEIYLKVLKTQTVWIMALSYFCLKFVRYAFMGWLTKYLYDRMHFSEVNAGYQSAIPELAGFLGAIFAGYVSDKYMGSRRGPISALMFYGLALACAVQGIFTAHGIWWNLAGLCLIYFMIYGPDTVMTGAGAMDFGSSRGAATAAGIINGMGSIGAAIQGPLLGWLADKYGWGFFFHIFIGLAVVGGLLMTTRWNAMPEKK
jgi:OPA family glycerol-3-phosphate transporter-like MFS transporter